MKRLGVLFLFTSVVLCGCGGGDGEVAAPELKAKPRIQYHVGMFMEYDPPWADHSRWMKPEAVAEQKATMMEKGDTGPRGAAAD